MMHLVPAALIALIGLLIPMSIHKVNEGHVGVYYRGGALINKYTEVFPQRLPRASMPVISFIVPPTSRIPQAHTLFFHSATYKCNDVVTKTLCRAGGVQRDDSVDHDNASSADHHPD